MTVPGTGNLRQFAQRPAFGGSAAIVSCTRCTAGEFGCDHLATVTTEDRRHYDADKQPGSQFCAAGIMRCARASIQKTGTPRQQCAAAKSCIGCVPTNLAKSACATEGMIIARAQPSIAIQPSLGRCRRELCRRCERNGLRARFVLRFSGGSTVFHADQSL